MNEPPLPSAYSSIASTLRLQDGEWHGPCPFCGEGDDRFFIFRKDGNFRCRKCERSGDGAGFLMEFEGLHYGEAMSRLGRREEAITKKMADAEIDRAEACVKLNYWIEYGAEMAARYRRPQAIDTVARLENVNDQEARRLLGYEVPMPQKPAEIPENEKPKNEPPKGVRVGRPKHGNWFWKLKDVQSFPYEDEKGNVLYEVGRVDYWDPEKERMDKAFSQRRQHGKQKKYSLEGVRRVPLYLPELRSRPEEPIHICEGEKGAKALRDAGFLATTVAQGADGWKSEYEYGPYFMDRDIVLHLDNDAGGDTMLRKSSAELADHVKSARVVDFPEFREKYDVYDFLEEHGPKALRDRVAKAEPMSGVALMQMLPPPARGKFDLEPEKAFDTEERRKAAVVGKALLELRDKRLYRDKHGTFEDFCRAEFGWSEQETKKHLEVAEIIEKSAAQDPSSVQEKTQKTQLRKSPSSEHSYGPASLSDINVQSARTIQRLVLPEPVWIVPEILPDGVTILAGPPKVGKSLAALNIAIAVASGGAALGKAKVEQGRVLYITWPSEATMRIMQSRINAMAQDGSAPDALDIVVTDDHKDGKHFWPDADNGGLERLREYIELHSPRLIVVDTLVRFRPRTRGNGDIYRQDYDAIRSLADMTQDAGIGVVLVHHTSKREAPDDPFDAISGSTGLIAAASTGMILRKGEYDRTARLYVRGREMAETEYVLEFDDRLMTWTLAGDAATYSANAFKRQILSALEELGEATPKEVAEHIDIEGSDGPKKVRTYMSRMLKENAILKAAYGKYKLPLRIGGSEEGPF